MRWSKKDKFYFKNLDKIEIEKSGRTEKAGKDTLFFFAFLLFRARKKSFTQTDFQTHSRKILDRNDGRWYTVLRYVKNDFQQIIARILPPL